ncbi:MAG: hypothetical protein M1356_06580 [Gammaproteobacteria bacterium]|nr:hypothetical protein [Gammaproteobacteria bacterium]
MKLNRDVLVNAILRHQSVFLRILDSIDTGGGANEFPESEYLRLYNQEICRDDDENVHNHLAINTLLENGVFIHNNRSSGTITVERVIIDLLRFIDVKRRRELTSADFESMRSQLYSAVSRLDLTEFGDDDYSENMQTVNQIISEIHSKVRSNVDTLTAQVGTIAERYENLQEHQGDYNVAELYDAISRLYERFVLPCLEFISPKVTMVQTRTFSQTMDDLIHYHSKRYAQNKVAREIGYRRTAITSYYKDIRELAGRLERYALYLDRDRQQFLAVEKAYQALDETLQPLRHGKRRSRLLTPTMPFFAQFQTFAGLRTFRATYSARLNWSAKHTPMQAREYLRSIPDKISDEPPVQRLKPVAAAPDPSLLRQQHIASVLDTALQSVDIFSDDITDIYAYVDSFLRTTLDDFSLVDTLYGYHSFLAFIDMGDVTVAYSGERNRLEDDKYYFDYLIPSISAEVSSGEAHKEVGHV